jgi:hypothetical protein
MEALRAAGAVPCWHGQPGVMPNVLQERAQLPHGVEPFGNGPSTTSTCCWNLSLCWCTRLDSVQSSQPRTSAWVVWVLASPSCPPTFGTPALTFCRMLPRPFGDCFASATPALNGPHHHKACMSRLLCCSTIVISKPRGQQRYGHVTRMRKVFPVLCFACRLQGGRLGCACCDGSNLLPLRLLKVSLDGRG